MFYNGDGLDDLAPFVLKTRAAGSSIVSMRVLKVDGTWRCFVFERLRDLLVCLYDCST